MPGKINGFTVTYGAVGIVLIWAGIKGASLSTTFHSLLGGTLPAEKPTPQEPINTTSAATAATGTTSTTPGVTSPGGEYSTAQLEALWKANSGNPDTAAFAAAVAMAESSGDPTVTSANPDGGTNVGLWQLDTKGVGAGYTVAELQDPETNAQITIMHTANGTNWEEWGDPVTEAVGYHYTPGGPVP